jgi:hypothetical protein
LQAQGAHEFGDGGGVHGWILAEMHIKPVDRLCSA